MRTNPLLLTTALLLAACSTTTGNVTDSPASSTVSSVASSSLTSSSSSSALSSETAASSAASNETSVEAYTTWETYDNHEFNFHVDYPPSLAPREFPNTRDGAGFHAVGTAAEPSNDVLTVGIYGRAGTVANLEFADYVQRAAIEEIQGYEELASIEEIHTTGGLTCYKTTWDGTEPGGPFTSLPIVYCPFEGQRSLVFQLIDPAYRETLDAMVPTVVTPSDAS